MDPGTGAGARPTAEFLVQAIALFAASGLRTWAGLLQVSARHGPDLVRVLEGASTGSDGAAKWTALAARFQQFAHELADVPGRESQVLYEQLRGLEVGAVPWPAIDDTPPPAQYWRPYGVKP
jgi:hypothetical protein